MIRSRVTLKKLRGRGGRGVQDPSVTPYEDMVGKGW